MGGIYFLGLFILFLLMVLHGYFMELADWLAGAVVLGLVRFIFLPPPSTCMCIHFLIFFLVISFMIVVVIYLCISTYLLNLAPVGF